MFDTCEVCGTREVSELVQRGRTCEVYGGAATAVGLARLPLRRISHSAKRQGGQYSPPLCGRRGLSFGEGGKMEYVYTDQIMNTVFFLGAGASFDAGYPLASELLTTIENFPKTTPLDETTKEEIKQFFNYRKNINEPLLKEVLNSPNPELVLTVPDLLKETLSESDKKKWTQLTKNIKSMTEEEAEKHNEYWNCRIRYQLVTADTVSRRFQSALHTFFGWKHYEDSQRDNHDKRDYFREAFKELQISDVIITTNWDTLAERTLIELEKWCPADGYGLDIKLQTNVLKTREIKRRFHECPDSAVKVLKLHGSVGWYREEDYSLHGEYSSIYLDHPYLLKYFPNHENLRDVNSPEVGPPLDPVFVIPSYLKQIEGIDMQSIWNQASRALHGAERIIFVGYSLPNADVAIRVLINSISHRVKNGDVEVTIIDPDSDVQDRFKVILGDKINQCEKHAKEAFMDSD